MRAAILALLACVLGACGEEASSGGTITPREKRGARKKEGDVAASAAPEYAYTPAGKRDPFQSFIRTGTSEEIRPDDPPLQRWDVDRYQLRGVIGDTHALIVDPEGRGHTVRLGNYVGRNWGKLTSIADGCVVITEEYQSLDGELVVNPVTVCFPAEARK